MPRPNDAAVIEQILRATGAIRQYTHGVHRGRFDRQPMMRDAVVLQLQVIGEEVTKLSATFKKAHPSMPWRAMSGLRNVIAHAYQRVDWDIIWTVAKQQVRDLAAYLRRIQKARLHVDIDGVLRKSTKK